MTVFLTVVAGVATLVVGQLFLRVIVEPIVEMRRSISDIAFAMIMRANVFSNRGTLGLEKEREVGDEIRTLASRLYAQMKLIPCYERIHWAFGLPPKTAVGQPQHPHLIGISNGLHDDAHGMGSINSRKADRVLELLGARLPEGETEPQEV